MLLTLEGLAMHNYYRYKGKPCPELNSTMFETVFRIFIAIVIMLAVTSLLVITIYRNYDIVRVDTLIGLGFTSLLSVAAIYVTLEGYSKYITTYVLVFTTIIILVGRYRVLNNPQAAMVIFGTLMPLAISDIYVFLCSYITSKHKDGYYDLHFHDD